MSKYKVIFHIDETYKWKLLLMNVSNLLEMIANEKFSVEVLANAEAVKYYDPTQNLGTDIETLENLKIKGVKFVACNNALKVYKIEKYNILDFVDTVPVGVLELVVKQSGDCQYSCRFS